MQKTDRTTLPAIMVPILDEQRELSSCLTFVAGLPLLRRVMMMAGKAGFGNLMVSCTADKEKLKAALAGTDVRLAGRAEVDVQAFNGPVLILAPDCLPDKDFFNSLTEICVQPDGVLLWQDEQAVLLGADCSPELIDCMGQSLSFEQWVKALCESDQAKSVLKANHEHVGQTVRNTKDCARAETALLSALVKQTEGWMALHINRKISLAVTRRLMHTAVTPNHMTWVSMILGLIGAACFLSPEHSMQIWGALFFLLHSILDGCDGELARLKFMESRMGGILDFWSDNIVHVAIFAAMGVGWAAHSPDSFWPLLCSALAVGGTAISASLVYFHTMHSENKAGPLYTSVSTAEDKSAVVRIADMLSRRDFIYLVLVLALFGQTHWFLVLTAIGAPVYALLLVGIMIREH